jgi:hypothetical protein
MHQPTLESIVKCLIIEMDHAFSCHVVDATVQATSRKIDRMPTVLKIGLSILAFVFNLHGIIRTGRFFHAQTISQKINQIKQWRNSPIGAFREFIIFHEKLTFFVYFSQGEL